MTDPKWYVWRVGRLAWSRRRRDDDPVPAVRIWDRRGHGHNVAGGFWWRVTTRARRRCG